MNESDRMLYEISEKVTRIDENVKGMLRCNEDHEKRLRAIEQRGGEDHEERIKKLEGVGGKRWELVVTSIISLLVAGGIGALLAKLSS